MVKQGRPLLEQVQIRIDALEAMDAFGNLGQLEGHSTTFSTALWDRFPILMMLETVGDHLKALRAVAGTGMLRPVGPVRPDVTIKIVKEIRKRGAIGAVPKITALSVGDRVGLVDELGSLTFEELDLRANALTNAWRAAGLRDGDGIAIMCRDHRGFADAMGANTKLGGSAIYLNTSFAAPQLIDVMTREGAKALVYDEE